MSDSFAGDYQVWLYEESDILTNCIKAIAAYRKQHGEYWPTSILISRNNRLKFGFGEGIDVKLVNDTWIINNAIYMCINNPMRDPADERKATAMQVKVRQPIVDVYETIYRMRSSIQYVMTLPVEENNA